MYEISKLHEAYLKRIPNYVLIDEEKYWITCPSYCICKGMGWGVLWSRISTHPIGLPALKDETYSLSPAGVNHLEAFPVQRCYWSRWMTGGGPETNVTCDWPTGSWIMQVLEARSKFPSWMRRVRSVCFEEKQFEVKPRSTVRVSCM